MNYFLIISSSIVFLRAGSKSQRHGRMSPSNVSHKSLSLMNQVDAMEYLQRQFEDDEEEEKQKKKHEIRKEMQVAKSGADDGNKTSHGGYTSMMMEQVSVDYLRVIIHTLVD